jgi:hypothetical protein
LTAEFNRRAFSDQVSAAPVVARAKRPEDVIARSALKRMQVGPQERRHDTDQQHPPPLAFRTGGTLNLTERKNGRQRLKFRHDASLEHDVDEYALSAHWFAVQYCSV